MNNVNLFYKLLENKKKDIIIPKNVSADDSILSLTYFTKKDGNNILVKKDETKSRIEKCIIHNSTDNSGDINTLYIPELFFKDALLNNESDDKFYTKSLIIENELNFLENNFNIKINDLNSKDDSFNYFPKEVIEREIEGEEKAYFLDYDFSIGKVSFSDSSLLEIADSNDKKLISDSILPKYTVSDNSDKILLSDSGILNLTGSCTANLTESYIRSSNDPIEIIAKKDSIEFLGFEIGEKDDKKILYDTIDKQTKGGNENIGSLIQLQYDTNNNSTLQFNANDNIFVQEGDLIYESVLRFARNEIMGKKDNYIIEYVETGNHKQHTKISIRNGVITIYTPYIEEIIGG